MQSPFESEVTEKQKLVWDLTNQIGIDVTHAFDDEELIAGLMDDEIIVLYISRKFNKIMNLVEPIVFIKHIVKIPEYKLKQNNINYKEFYFGMTCIEALEIVVLKLLGNNSITVKNLFHPDLNYNGNANTMNKTLNGKYWFPYVRNGQLPFNDLLSTAIKDFNIDHSTHSLLFRGTNWGKALSTNHKTNRVESSGEYTDFGMENFYLTDDFYTACNWANRNQQCAVVIFSVPKTMVENLKNKIQLNHTTSLNEWKKFVFYNRISPTDGPNFCEKQSEHENFIDELDKNDLVSGPIFLNPYVTRSEDVEFVITGEKIPYQYSFKESSCHLLHQFILTTIYVDH